MRVLIIDNYDSFVWNLAQYMGVRGADVEVVRNDQKPLDELVAGGFDRVIISAGPGRPADAGVTLAAIPAFAQAGVPALGVCLGEQAMVEAFGGTIVPTEPVHGKSLEIDHDGRGVFTGLPDRLEVGCYHSLAVDRVPEEFEVTARHDDLVMAVRHRDLPIEGLQFHPESVLTPEGEQMIDSFLEPDYGSGR